MMAASESGCSVADLVEMSPKECESWILYSLEGPSTARTQLLLAQLIQMVSAALGGQRIKLDRLLPWYSELTKPDKTSVRMRQEIKSRTTVLGMLERRKRKNNGK